MLEQAQPFGAKYRIKYMGGTKEWSEARDLTDQNIEHIVTDNSIYKIVVQLVLDPKMSK